MTTLKAAGLRIVMATGEGFTTARSVGARLGIDEVHGEVRPAGKLLLVARLQKEGRVVAMTDDGINDAPALAQADVELTAVSGLPPHASRSTRYPRDAAACGHRP